MSALKSFISLLEANRSGEGVGIYSVCSSHEMVLKASMMRALEDNSILIIESTSNQVDQNGGYTGMTPPDFVRYVNSVADSVGFPVQQIVLGGDHLGPNVWQGEPSTSAMDKACVLVREYVKAGYQKIHLDASMPLADDVVEPHRPLADEIVAERAARLCEVSEQTWREYRPGTPAPVYIIGTEVPIPGGAKIKEEFIHPTSPEDAARTVEVTKAAFLARGLEDAWSRVVATVVQPGVEFGDEQVFDYIPENASRLSARIKDYPGMVYEAHSTDYQTLQGLTSLVKDHFCILKVGPWLTFAYREAVFALELIEKEMSTVKSSERSFVSDVLDRVMLEKPGYWKKYYSGTESEQEFKRKYSLSDRSRYYWPDLEVQKAVGKLMGNLSTCSIPLSLLSQYMPTAYSLVRDNKLDNNPEALICNRVDEVLRIYSRACGF